MKRRIISSVFLFPLLSWTQSAATQSSSQASSSAPSSAASVPSKAVAAPANNRQQRPPQALPATPVVPNKQTEAPKTTAPSATSSSSSSSSKSAAADDSDVGFLSPVMLGVSEEAAEMALPSEKLVTLERQVKLLDELVNISSDTHLEIEGVNKVQAIVARELKALKFKVEEINNPDPFVKSGKLIVGTYAGKTDSYITLLAHADTVFSANSGFKKFSHEDLRASGSGVIDNKGGIVVGLEALRRYLAENPTPQYSLRFVVSPSEEAGSTGFLGLFEQFSLSSIAVFGLEPALDEGDIVTSRKGDRWYDVTIKGREAHAGRAHEQGVNACTELALKIEKLQKLTDYKKNVSINVGSMRGGRDKFAIVCGEAGMKLDVRFADSKNRAIIIKKVEDILKAQYVKSKNDGMRAQTEWKIVDDPLPFAEEKKVLPLVEIYKKVIFDLETYKLSAKRSGGTSDINFFYRPGLILIDGLGPVGSGMHTVDESIVLRSLLTRSEALAKLIQAASL